MRNVYALLVGVSQYDERLRLSQLAGCVADMQQMQTYLEGRLSSDVKLHLRTLTNKQATREAIVSGFRQHLAQASSGDTALFYFSGYGSSAIALPPTAPSSIETNPAAAATETLVCYNSRIDDQHWDIASTELSQLLAEVSQQQAHVTAIINAQAIAADGRSRPENSLLTSTHEHPGRYLMIRDRTTEPTGYSISQSSPFARCLQTSLVATNQSPTYQDLLKRTSMLLRSAFPTRSIDIQATHPEDLNRPFLGEGAVAPLPPYFTLSHDTVQGWVINGGSIHGLRTSTDEKTANEKITTLAIFPQEATPEQMQQISAARSFVRIAKVFPLFSKVEDAGFNQVLSQAGQSEIFRAVVVGLPLSRLRVWIEGDTGEVNALKRAIAAASPNRQPSLYLQQSDRKAAADLSVLAQNGSYTLLAACSDRSLIDPISGYDAASAARTVSAMEHIARWRAIAELSSPANSAIKGTVELKLFTGDETDKAQSTEITDVHARLLYRQAPQNHDQAATPSYVPPRFRIKIYNNSNQTLHCALFYLTERFKAAAVRPDKINSTVQLAPQEEVWFADGLPLYGTVPDDLWQQGVTECQDAMKLVASTQPFDPTLMNLGAIATLPASPVGPEKIASDLDWLMQRIIHRELSEDLSEIPALAHTDWITGQIAFTFVRPQRAITLPPVGQQTSGDSKPFAIGPAADSASVEIQSHPQFSAAAQLATAAHTEHTFGRRALSSLVQGAPFQFSHGRHSSPGLSIIQLAKLAHPESVTPEQPLRIETDWQLAAGEYLLPVAYDGESYRPLGYGKTEQGKTRIVIEQLPSSTLLPSSAPPNAAEPADRAVCIACWKLNRFQPSASRPVQLPAHPTAHLPVQMGERSNHTRYPLLSAVQITQSGEVHYTYNKDAIAFKVKQSEAIALYIPSPFSDSDLDLLALQKTLVAAGQPYDLLLSFDGDAAQGSVIQSAQLLKDGLGNIGLTAGHAKKLHCIAHSTGGLTARWFIEQLGGKESIDHLMMLGTPNGGLLKPQVKAGITEEIARILNGESSTLAPKESLSNLIRFTDTANAALSAAVEEIQPDSACIQTLSTSPEPNVSYTCIQGQLDRIVGSSANAMPENWTTAPEQRSVICNHLEYLTHPQSVATLGQVFISAIAQPKRIKPSKAPTKAPTKTLAKAPIIAQVQLPETAATPAAIGAASATSAGIAAASIAVASTAQPLPNQPTHKDPSAMQEPPHSEGTQPPEPNPLNQPTNPQPAINQPTVNQPTVNQPVNTQPFSTQPPISKPAAEQALTPQPARPYPPDISAEPPSVNAQGVNAQEPSEVYAPAYEPSPESESSPLMWVWLLFTACLAGLMAWAWIAHLNSPVTPSGADTIESAPEATPDSEDSVLPSLPEAAPIAPGGET